MKTLFSKLALLVALVVVFFPHSVRASFEYAGALDPKEIVKWEHGQVLFANGQTQTVFYNPDPTHLIIEVEAIMQVVKEQNAKGEYDAILIKYRYILGTFRYSYAREGGSFKEVVKRKVLYSEESLSQVKVSI